MATIQQLIREQADLHGVPFWIIEKDYALSYLLKAISIAEGLGDALVLKGGTALRKLYFRDYRFSEDLDYSTREIGPIARLDARFNAAIQIAENLLRDRGAFRVEHQALILRETHLAGQSCYIVRVKFPYHREALCRLKVEITIDEPILLRPARRSIVHDFAENLVGEAPVYQLQEVVAEKLRALLQSLARIENRGWGSGRVARDYYDLWFLLKNGEFSGDELVDLTRKKSSIRNVQASSVNEFFSPMLVESARRQWEKQLRIFVPDAPGADVVIEETRSILNELWGP